MIITGTSARAQSPLPFRSFIVTTGSMIPAIMPGDIVFVTPKSSYSVHDIITFKSNDGHTITHRIIEKRASTETSFTTKGDNNKTPDTEGLPQKSIIGKVRYTVPKIGRLLLYLSKPTSLFFLLTLPLLVLIAGEVFKEKKQP